MVHWNTLLLLRLLLFKEALDPAFKEYGEMLSRMPLPWRTFSINIQISVLSQVGTNNHLFLVDVTKVVENGKVAQNVLKKLILL